MSSKPRLALLGSSPNILLFKAIGMSVYAIQSLKELDQKVFDLVKEDYQLIYVEESWYSQMQETLDKYKTQSFPIFVPLPMDEKSLQVGLKKIKNNVGKAIGIDIF